MLVLIYSLLVCRVRTGPQSIVHHRMFHCGVDRCKSGEGCSSRNHESPVAARIRVSMSKFSSIWCVICVSRYRKECLLDLMKIRFHSTDNFTFYYDANKNDMIAFFGQCEDVSVVEAEEDIFETGIIS
jgi:hypothetical protein